MNVEALAAAERYMNARSEHQPLLKTLLDEYTRRGAELIARIAELDRLTAEIDQLRAEQHAATERTQQLTVLLRCMARRSVQWRLRYRDALKYACVGYASGLLRLERNPAASRALEKRLARTDTEEVDDE